MNTISIIGRITNDIELRTTPNDKKVTTLRVAIPKRKGSDGKERESTFVDVNVWGPQAEVVAQHLSKGRKVGVTGRLDHDNWTDKHDQRRTTLLIVASDVDFIDSPRNADD